MIFITTLSSRSYIFYEDSLWFDSVILCKDFYLIDYMLRLYAGWDKYRLGAIHLTTFLSFFNVTRLQGFFLTNTFSNRYYFQIFTHLVLTILNPYNNRKGHMDKQNKDNDNFRLLSIKKRKNRSEENDTGKFDIFL